MDAGLIILVACGAVALITLLIVWGTYNSLVAQRNKVREGFSGIYVQLKRRVDLIPNLIKTVQGYATHEREIFENVARLRTAFLNVPQSNQSAVMAQEGLLTQALKSVFAVAENYPALQASENFQKLQESLEETEDQIAAARRIYNANVNAYNTSAQQFPSNVIARWFGFSDEPFYKTEESVEQVPQVSF